MQRRLPAAPNDAPVLHMHHQVWWGILRLLEWYRPVWDLGNVPFPGDREWLTLVREWQHGSTRSVWFLSDISRDDLVTFDPRARTLEGRYRQRPDVRGYIGGYRLDSLDWWTIRRPAWMLGTGWSLSPEMAGVASADRTGPHQQPAEAFLLRGQGPMRVMIGGRYFGPGAAATLTADLDGREIARWRAAPDSPWFVQWIDLPDGAGEGADPYARLTVQAASDDPARPAPFVGLEQFDAAPVDGVIAAFAADWHEPEESRDTGQLWRWTSDRSTLIIKAPNRDLTLVVSGESPLRYFDHAPEVIVRAGDVEVGRFHPDADFTWRIALPAAALAASSGRVTIETSLTFVPGDREASPDRRRLGLRLFQVEVRAR
jgi:hypothetical protein